MNAQLENLSDQEKRQAHEAYNALTETLKSLKNDSAPFKVQDATIELPAMAIKLLQEIMKNLAAGQPVSIVPIATEVTTQKAAELLGVSRPYVVKLIDSGELEAKKVGRHRRLKFEDVMIYKKKMISQRKKALDELIALDQKYGLL